MTNIMVNLVYSLHLYTTYFDRKTCSTIYFGSLSLEFQRFIALTILTILENFIVN
jgi:hypothetical protein